MGEVMEEKSVKLIPNTCTHLVRGYVRSDNHKWVPSHICNKTARYKMEHEGNFTYSCRMHLRAMGRDGWSLCEPEL